MRVGAVLSTCWKNRLVLHSAPTFSRRPFEVGPCEVLAARAEGNINGCDAAEAPGSIFKVLRAAATKAGLRGARCIQDEVAECHRATGDCDAL